VLKQLRSKWNWLGEWIHRSPRYYSGHRKAAEEEGDPVIPGKGTWRKNVEAGFIWIEEEGVNLNLCSALS